MKENEIQIVTLEKQKDTYQVISPEKKNSLEIKLFYLGYVSIVNNLISGVWASDRSDINLEYYAQNNRVHHNYEPNVQVLKTALVKTIEQGLNQQMSDLS